MERWNVNELMTEKRRTEALLPLDSKIITNRPANTIPFTAGCPADRLLTAPA